MDSVTSMLSEFTGAFTGGTIGGYILGGIYVLAILLALVGLSKGWLRGARRAATRLVTVVLAMGLTVYLAIRAFPYFSALCDGKTLLEVLQILHLDGLLAGEGAVLSVLRGMEGESLVLLSALPAAMVIIPVAMVLVFVLSSALLLLLHALICGIFGWQSHCTTTFGRFIGAFIGFVQGAAVALFLCIPLFSGMSYMGAMCDASPETSKLSVQYDTYVRQTNDSALAQTVRQFGGDQLMGLIEGQMLFEDKPIDLDSLASTVGGMIGQVQFLDGADFKAMTPEQEAALREIVKLADGSREAEVILANIMEVSAKTLSEYKDRLPFEEPFLTTVQDFISYFENDPEDAHAVEDLSTFIEVYIVLMRSDVLNQTSAPDAATEAFKSGALREAVNLLEANPRTAPLADSVMSFAFAAVAESLPADAGALYDAVSEDLRACVKDINASSLSGNAYKESLSYATVQLLQDNGLIVNQDGVAAMAEYIADGNNDVDTWTDSDLRKVLFTYFE